MREAKTILLSLLLSTITTSSGQSWTEVNNYIQHLENQNLFSGTISVYKNGESIFNNNFGYSNFNSREKINESTKFAIGSITKNFTRAAIFQLEKDHLISFEDKISLFFPQLKNSETISINNLINHTSGLPNYSSFSNFTTLSEKQDFEIVDLIKELNNYPLNFNPGDSKEYSSTNYALLTEIIEIITMAKYMDYLDKTIFKPYNFHCTSSTTNKVNTDLAIGYETADNKTMLRIAKPNNSKILIGSGDLSMCQKDILSFIKMINNGDVLNTKQWLGNFELDSYLNKDYYWTAGFVNGFVAKLLWFPKSEIVILFNTNINNGGHNEILNLILATMFEEDYSPRLFEIEKTKVDNNLFLGRYTFGDGPNYFSIEIKEDKLFFRFKKQDKLFPLIPTDDNTLFMPNDFAWFSFAKNEKGKYESGFYTLNNDKITIKRKDNL